MRPSTATNYRAHVRMNHRYPNHRQPEPPQPLTPPKTESEKVGQEESEQRQEDKETQRAESPEPELETEVEPEPELETEVEPEPELETEVEPDPELETEVEPDPEPKAELGEPTGFYEFDLELNAGWNLVHIPLDLLAIDNSIVENETVGELFYALDVDMMFYHDAGSWLLADENTTVIRKSYQGFAIYVEAPVTKTLLGLPLSGNLVLQEGMNLVGIPRHSSKLKRVSDLLSFYPKVIAILVEDEGILKSCRTGRRSRRHPDYWWASVRHHQRASLLHHVLRRIVGNGDLRMTTLILIICMCIVSCFILVASAAIVFWTAQSYDGYRALLVITFMLGTIREFYDLPLFFWEWSRT